MDPLRDFLNRVQTYWRRSGNLAGALVTGVRAFRAIFLGAEHTDGHDGRVREFGEQVRSKRLARE